MFDDVIGNIKSWFEEKRAEGLVRHYQLSSAEADASSDLSNNNGSVILRGDTHLELGHPGIGSLNASLTTGQSALVEHGRISLVGPEVFETQANQLPFAQIAVALCRKPVDDTPFLMDRTLHTSAQTSGYMVRSQPNAIWARVSKQAALEGFSLEQLGKRLIPSLLQRMDHIEKLEIYFVTSSKSDILELTETINPARSRLNKLKTFSRTEDGDYECDTSLDCDDCPEQEVCDTIRDVIKIRKGDRVISFGEDPPNGTFE